MTRSPGDPFTNFGFGFGQGPAQLGDQVVARQQLGALNPTTGKSLDWNPGSDSFLGAQSLTFVEGHGLLVGHDGNRFGGANIGRHAFFPLGNDPTGPVAPGGGFVCSISFDGSTAVLTYSGDRAPSEQLRRNNNWAGNVTGEDSSRIANAVGDDFSVRLRGAGFDDPFSEVPCTTGGGGGGTVQLDTSITSPTNAQVVAPGNITITGEASAPDGIRRVRLVVVRTVDRHYLNEDGSYTPTWAPIDIDLNTNDEERTWSETLNITQSGEYNLSARTFDRDGTRDETVASVQFIVGSTDDDPPELTVTGPVNPSPGNTAVIEGSVSDDLGVQSVTFTIREQDRNLFLRPDGTLGGSHTFTASLTNPGATFTQFSSTLTNVPVGDYQVRIEARDTSGQRFVRSRGWAQLGDTSPPTIEITSGAEQKGAPNSRFTFSGTAEAEAGIENIQVLIREVVDWRGVGANGNLSARANYFTIPGTNGGTTRNWSYQSPQLASGTYNVFFRLNDDLGSRVIASTQIVSGPGGDDTPTQTVTGALRFQQGVDGLTIDLGGTATDDRGVESVTIQIYDADERQWLQTDGSFDVVPDPVTATLQSPGAQSTNWTYTFNAPEPSTYWFLVRAVDDAGQATRVHVFSSARVYPGDDLPTVTVNSPNQNQVITTNRISVNGRADDDNGLSAVEVLFRNIDTGQYLQADGSLGGFSWLDAALTNPGADRTNFDLATPVLPDGTWDVTVRAVDNRGQTTTPTTRVRVTLE